MDHFDGMIITRDVWCVGCGYNLRTLEIASRCPECGAPVEQSLLDLPNPGPAAGAIKLAAWSTVVSFGAVCASPSTGIASLMMLVAVHRLCHRCELARMAALAGRLHWLWRTTCLATVGILILLIHEWATGSPSGSLDAACTPKPVVGPISVAQSLSAPRPGEGLVRIAVTNTSATVELANDGEGGIVASTIDASGRPIGVWTLVPDTAVTLSDVDGRAFDATLDSAGVVTVTAPNTMVLSAPTPGIAAMAVGLLEVVAMIAGFAAGVMYLLVCRALAGRAQQPRLAANFRTILWVLGLGMLGLAGGVALVWAGAFTAAFPTSGSGLARLTPAIIVGALLFIPAVVLLLVSAIWQIVASFQLAGALARAPSDLSEIAAVPE